MRVLYLHQHFTTPAGAGGTRSYEMARRLVAAGHEVVIVCGSMEGADTGLHDEFVSGMRRGTVDGIEVVEFRLPYGNGDGFARRSTTFLRYARRAAWLALREPCDLILATSTPLTVAIPAMLGKWIRGKPFIFEVRDLWPALPAAMGAIRNPLVIATLRLLEWASYRSADRLVALAPGIEAGIEARGVPADAIALIPNASDVALFGDRSRAWRPGGTKDTDLLVVYTGAHGVANGLDALVDLAAVLQRRGRTDIQVLLVGSGGRKPALQSRVTAAGLTQIRFLPPMSKRDLAGLLAAADVGFQCLANVPAFYEGTSPNKFFDYLASGLPVVTNYPGWLARLIEENDCGVAVRPGDAEALADAIEKLAADRGRLREQGDNARRLAVTRFDRDRLGREFVAWIEAARPALA